MANVVFKTGTNTVSIDFGVLAAAAQVKKAKWRFDALPSVFLLPNDAAVVVRNLNAKDYPFSFDGVNGLKVDLVDDIAPTSNDHLFDLISDVMS